MNMCANSNMNSSKTYQYKCKYTSPNIDTHENTRIRTNMKTISENKTRILVNVINISITTVRITMLHEKGHRNYEY